MMAKQPDSRQGTEQDKRVCQAAWTTVRGCAGTVGIWCRCGEQKPHRAPHVCIDCGSANG